MKRDKVTQNRAVATRIIALTSQGVSPETIHHVLESEFPISLNRVKKIIKQEKENQVRLDTRFRELEILYPQKGKM